MEKCPECKDNTLGYDPLQGVANCTSLSCDFIMEVASRDEYFKSYVISELNWSNYCAKTPRFIRELRDTMVPLQFAKS